MAAGAYWRCPVCLRRVPDKVRECYCGRIRQPVDGPDEADRPKPLPWVPAALGTGVVAFVALALWLTRPTLPSAARRTPSPSPSAGQGVAPSAASTPGEGSSSPAPTTTTLPGSARAYDFALRHVQARLAGLSARLDQFDRICGRGSRHSSCDSMRDQIAQDARDIRNSFDEAEARARQDFVDGGVLMELRHRNAVGEGDIQAALSRAAAATGLR